MVPKSSRPGSAREARSTHNLIVDGPYLDTEMSTAATNESEISAGRRRTKSAVPSRPATAEAISPAGRIRCESGPDGKSPGRINSAKTMMSRLRTLSGRPGSSRARSPLSAGLGEMAVQQSQPGPSKETIRAALAAAARPTSSRRSPVVPDFDLDELVRAREAAGSAMSHHAPAVISTLKAVSPPDSPLAPMGPRVPDIRSPERSEVTRTGTISSPMLGLGGFENVDMFSSPKKAPIPRRVRLAQGLLESPQIDSTPRATSSRTHEVRYRGVTDGSDCSTIRASSPSSKVGLPRCPRPNERISQYHRHLINVAKQPEVVDVSTDSEDGEWNVIHTEAARKARTRPSTAGPSREPGPSGIRCTPRQTRVRRSVGRDLAEGHDSIGHNTPSPTNWNSSVRPDLEIPAGSKGSRVNKLLAVYQDGNGIDDDVHQPKQSKGKGKAMAIIGNGASLRSTPPSTQVAKRFFEVDLLNSPYGSAGPKHTRVKSLSSIDPNVIRNEPASGQVYQSGHNNELGLRNKLSTKPDPAISDETPKAFRKPKTFREEVKCRPNAPLAAPEPSLWRKLAKIKSLSSLKTSSSSASSLSAGAPPLPPPNSANPFATSSSLLIDERPGLPHASKSADAKFIPSNDKTYSDRQQPTASYDVSPKSHSPVAVSNGIVLMQNTASVRMRDAHPFATTIRPIENRIPGSVWTNANPQPTHYLIEDPAYKRAMESYREEQRNLPTPFPTLRPEDRPSSSAALRIPASSSFGSESTAAARKPLLRQRPSTSQVAQSAHQPSGDSANRLPNHLRPHHTDVNDFPARPLSNRGAGPVPPRRPPRPSVARPGGHI
jgi:hypothetical protein